jgi:cytoskeletal protein CcmA (bactofilin family)
MENSTNKLLFRDTGLYINSSTDGQLDLVADTEIQIAATTIDINGAIAMDGAITGATNITLSGELDAATLDISGNADIDGTLEADAITINGTAIGSIYGVVAGSSSIVTTGALDSGSITSGFGTIDTGSSTITTTGLISGGSLDIDNVLINGTTIGHTDDTDLLTVADGLLTVAGEISVTTLDIGGTNVTTTAAELNLIDGGASTGTTAVADADGILTNDGGTMRLTTAATFKTYFQSGVTASSIAADDISAGDAAVSIGNGNTSADVTLDSGDDIVIDAAGGNVEFKDAGTLQLTLDMDGTAGEQIIQLGVNSDDLVFKQYDGTEVFRMEDGAYLNVSNTTASSSSTTGSAIFGGGIGVAADANIGDDLTLRSDSAVLGFGADNDTTLTHTDGTGLTLNSTNKLCFQDTGTYVGSNADGDLDVVSDGTAVDSINLESAGGITLDAGTAASGIIYEDDGTEMLRIHNSSSDVIIEAKVQDKDIIFKGDDGGSGVTALTLDMSAGGIATFSAAANVAQQAITSSSNAIAWDASDKPNAYHQTTENTTLSAPSNAVEGAFICIEINFNGSHTFSWNAIFNFAADTAPTTTDTDGKTDIFVFRYNGAIWQEVGRTLNIPES